MAEPDLLEEPVAEAIFEHAIRAALLSGRTPKEQPVAILIGGQPGAGKSVAQATVLEQLGRTDAVGVDVDDLRAFHPRYLSAAMADDRAAAAITQADAQRWARMLLRSARAARLDVVLSTTLRDPATSADQVDVFKRAGYRVEVLFMAVDLARSGLGALQRYVAQRRDIGYGRYVAPDVQRAVYEGMLATADRIDSDSTVVRAHVFRRGGVRVYSNEVREGQWWRPAGLRKAIEIERARPWSSDEQAHFRDAVTRLRTDLPAELTRDLEATTRDALPFTAGPAATARKAFPRAPQADRHNVAATRDEAPAPSNRKADDTDRRGRSR
jgi:hypothetical protein